MKRMQLQLQSPKHEQNDVYFYFIFIFFIDTRSKCLAESLVSLFSFDSDVIILGINYIKTLSIKIR